MNSIRRPRRRPRVRSVNFRTLWWVLAREAAFAVCYQDGLGEPWELYWRRHLARMSTDRVRRYAEHVIAVDPPRRFIPRGQL